MKLNLRSIQEEARWEGVALPRFDVEAVRRRTLEAPRWVHFGAGNIFRAFPAALMQQLLDEGRMDTGIVVAEGFDGEIIERAYRPYDDLSLLAVLKVDGAIERRVIASVARSLRVDGGRGADWELLQSCFEAQSLQMASFTITEKGYGVTSPDGALLPPVARDVQAGPEAASSLMGKLSALIYARYRAGGAPLALVSMDNCSHNGDKLARGVETVCRGWLEAGHVEQAFLSYLAERVCFPLTMIDKITPRPDESVARMLAEAGFEDGQIIVTQKHTYTAPFVNAEEAQYLVVEDRFPNGRPPLEHAGVLFCDRETVDRVEKMKVCTCLNPLHTALAILGCLLGYQRISEEMRDPQLVALVRRIGYQEGMPVVVDPGVLSPETFLDQVLTVRLPNPFMPDSPQRIATDTSQKLAIRFGETIKAYRQRGLSLEGLQCIPFVFAAYLRLLMGVDDQGQPLELSPDPRLDELKERLGPVTLGGAADQAALDALLNDGSLFGLSLTGTPLAPKVKRWFGEMIAGPGAVRRALKALLEA